MADIPIVEVEPTFLEMEQKIECASLADETISDAAEAKTISENSEELDKLCQSLPGVSTSADAALAAPRAAPRKVKKAGKRLSTYGLFFRDCAVTIRQQNPNCKFKELSSIVSSLWADLDPAIKNAYSKRAEEARVQYELKKLPTAKPSGNVPQAKPKIVLQKKTNDSEITAVDTVAAIIRNLIEKALGIETQMQNTSAAGSTQVVCEVPRKCIRENCNNPVSAAPDSEVEYCSNQCVGKDCRIIVTAWLYCKYYSEKQSNPKE